MSRITEMETSASQQELMFPCDCHESDHMVRISWDPSYEGWHYLSVCTVDRPRGLDRIKVAWKALRGLEYTQAEVIMNEKCVASLKAFLEEV